MDEIEVNYIKGQLEDWLYNKDFSGVHKNNRGDWNGFWKHIEEQINLMKQDKQTKE